MTKHYLALSFSLAALGLALGAWEVVSSGDDGVALPAPFNAAAKASAVSSDNLAFDGVAAEVVSAPELEIPVPPQTAASSRTPTFSPALLNTPTHRFSPAAQSQAATNPLEANGAVPTAPSAARTNYPLLPERFPAPRAQEPARRSPQPSPLFISPVAASAPPLLVELGRGTQKPAAMLEAEPPLSPEQAGAREQVTDAFEEEISEAADALSTDPDAMEQAWSQARVRADQRFRLLFGDQAYNRANIRAGQEAAVR